MEESFGPFLPKLERLEASTPADLPAGFAEKIPAEDFRPETLPTAACSLSHLRCWRAIADGPADGALIFEDDIWPGPKFGKRLKAFRLDPDRPLFDLVFVNKRMRHWLAIAEEHCALPGAIVSLEAILVALRGAEPDAGRKNGWRLPHIGGEGYWLSRRGAATLIEIARLFPKPSNVDWVMASAAAARTPEALRVERMRYYLEDLGLLQAVRSAGGLSAGVARDFLVANRVGVTSVRRERRAEAG